MASTSTATGPSVRISRPSSGPTAGWPAIRTATVVNFGDQAAPDREPLIPGRPTHPVQCSGSRATRTGSSTTLGATGATPASDQRLGVRVGQLAQVGPPVHDGGQLPGAYVEQN